MRTTFTALLALAALVITSNLSHAQAPGTVADAARLAGTWQLDTSGNPTLPAERRVIAVSPDWLRVEILRAVDDRPPVLTYRFDGQDVVNPFGSGKAISRLLQENGAVTTETIFEVRDAPITVRETLSLNADGTEMTVVTTLRVEHGYQGTQTSGESKPPNVSSATMVYRRQP